MKDFLTRIGLRKKKKSALQSFCDCVCGCLRCWGRAVVDHGLVYGIGLGIGFAMYAASMYWFYAQGQDILFYRGIVLMLIDAVVFFAVVYGLCVLVSKKILPSLKNKNRFKGCLAHYAGLVKTQVLGLTLAGLFFNLAFHGTVTTSLDRAISVFLLGYSYKIDRPFTTDDWKNEFQQVYVKKYGAIERRVAEQLASGNIEKTPDGKMVLTAKGKKTVASWLVFNRILNVNNRFVSPDVIGK